MLVTNRLELWRPAATDREGLHRLVQPDEVRRFLGPTDATARDSFARHLRNAGSWALYGYGNFIVRERGRGTIAGICGVFHSWRGFGGMDDVPEAGWIVAHEHWGKGHATEAMRAALAWFDAAHGAQRVVCMIEQGHGASETVARRLGFAEFARHQAEDGAPPMVLYERRPAPAP